MSGGFTGRVILCWPSNRDEIARLNQLAEAGQEFVPTIEHSLSRCDGCGRGIWIARQQLQLANSPFVRSRKLCMFCVDRVTKTLNVDVHETDIAPDVAHARRRTV